MPSSSATAFAMAIAFASVCGRPSLTSDHSVASMLVLRAVVPSGAKLSSVVTRGFSTSTSILVIGSSFHLATLTQFFATTRGGITGGSS